MTRQPSPKTKIKKQANITTTDGDLTAVMKNWINKDNY